MYNILSNVIKNSLIFMLIERLFMHANKYTMKHLLNDKYTKIENKNKFLTKISENATAILHTVVALYYSYFILVDPIFWADRLYYTSALSTQLGTITCGYFLYDTIICIRRYNTSGIAFLIHGIVCLLVNSFSLVFKIGHFHWAASIIWELSTPFVHLRSLLLKLDIKTFRKINDILLITIFFFARILCGFYFGYSFWTDVITNDRLLRNQSFILYHGLHIQLLLNMVMNILNIYWFSLMLKKIKL